MKVAQVRREEGAEGGRITAVEVDLDLDNKDYKKTLKVTWLANRAENFAVKTVRYEHLISTPIISKEEDWKEFVNRDSEHFGTLLAEPALRKVNCGDILQIQRKSFYICDAKTANSMTLIEIPDGKETNNANMDNSEMPTFCARLLPNGDDTQMPTFCARLLSNGDDTQMPTFCARLLPNGDDTEMPTFCARLLSNGDDTEMPTFCARLSPNGDDTEMPTFCARLLSNGDDTETSTLSARLLPNGDDTEMPTFCARLLPNGDDSEMATFCARLLPNGDDSEMATFCARLLPKGDDSEMATFCARLLPSGDDSEMATFCARILPSGDDSEMATFSARILPSGDDSGMATCARILPSRDNSEISTFSASLLLNGDDSEMATFCASPAEQQPSSSVQIISVPIDQQPSTSFSLEAQPLIDESPVCKHFRHTILVKKSPKLVYKPKLIVPDPESPSVLQLGLRRSKRSRLPRLLAHMGQTAKYERDKDGNQVLVGATELVVKDRFLKKHRVADSVTASLKEQQLNHRKQIAKRKRRYQRTLSHIPEVEEDEDDGSDSGQKLMCKDR
ncbi:hypothetical protein niasHT_037087 [Heterodera trifolii]|uniref:tRNA synthetases class I (E and Q) anti-codon binding domain-containing protein n=1 Tax=Heterodera trifolii TaxID=157864 RepID=A0ABD2IPC1_9BILA